MQAALAGTERAALQQADATIPQSAAPPASPNAFMPQAENREFLIQGITQDGRAFRPSDWAERLAGAMSSFRPDASALGAGRFIGYSPYCVPRVIDGVRCVIVNEALRDIEPMAWDFVMNFARDNGLRVAQACLTPGPSSKPM
jgi:hypothetical protein